VRARCTRAASRPRQLSLRPREEHAALLAARQRQAGADFATRYRRRAGVEGTIAQGVRGRGLRRARYRTLPKVRLEHVAIAVGISLQRLDDWWTETPRAFTRTSRFAALAVA
jgi:transposase